MYFIIAIGNQLKYLILYKKKIKLPNYDLLTTVWDRSRGAEETDVLSYIFRLPSRSLNHAPSQGANVG